MGHPAASKHEEEEPMPDSAIKCPSCERKILLQWPQSTGSALYDYHCPYGCGAGLQVQATPPIYIHRLDSTGNWEPFEIIGANAVIS